MRILCTGDQGFVGAETVRLLIERGHQVVGYDVMFGNDIRDIKQLESSIAQWNPDRILHLAAIARFSDADAQPWLAYQTNVLGTVNVAAVATKFHKPVVYASTGSVYMPIKQKPPITEDFWTGGNSNYGVTKHLGELAIKRGTAPYIILRYAHLYGREKRMHGLIGGYLDRIKRGLAPTLYGGKQSNDFTYIKDVARANVCALEAPWDKWNQVYNVGTGEELSAEKAGDLVIKTWNVYNPKEKFKGKVDKREVRTVDPERFVYDTTKAEVMLGFKAEFDFEKGLHDMFAPGIVVSPIQDVDTILGEDEGEGGVTSHA